MPPVVSIRNWSNTYEVSDAKRCRADRPLAWVPLPTKHDGRGYRRLMKREDGMELFAAFVLMVEVAGKMPKRGVLEDTDGPLTPDDLAEKTGADQTTFTKAIQVLSDKELGINWLEVSGDTSGYSDILLKSAPTGQYRTVQTGQDRTVQTPQPPEGGVFGAAAKRETVVPPKRDTSPNYTPGFLAFWASYPPGDRKVAKSNCARTWSRKGLERIAEQVMAALERWKASRAWTKDGGAYIPMPQKWLKDTPWETDPAEQAPPANAHEGNGFNPDLDRYVEPSEDARALIRELESEQPL